MTAYIIGAGASKAYEDSPSELTMPLAKEVFSTFNKLNIARDPNVLIGKTLNYLKSEHGLDYEDFEYYNEDVEKLYSEVECKLELLQKSEKSDEKKEALYWGTYVELMFIFSSVINSIQNGPTSVAHKNFISSLKAEDSIITFNWDTLIDRALNETGLWHTDSGYIIHPKKIFRDGWQTIRPSKKSFIKLLKLHGSVNWLTSYPQQGETSLFEFSHAGSIEEFAVFEYATKPYPCYQGRYMDGFAPFSFGYYPPNLDFEGKKAPEGHIFIRIVPKTPFMTPPISSKEGLDSIPLIIPPVKHKEYDRFGALFETLWNEAENELAKADHIVILGYSFPQTDTKAIHLMKKACCKKGKMPFVTIVNPYPDGIVDLLQRECGLTNFRVIKECITKKFDFARLKKQTFNLPICILNAKIMFSYLIIGAGLFGATFANLAKKTGKSVLVIDKRPHIAGNCYTETIEDINVHKYGAHIFHTSNKDVWRFVNSFVEFNRYTNSPIAKSKGQYYNLPFNMNTFNQMWGAATPEAAEAKIEEQKAEILKRLNGREPANLEEQALSLVGRDIFETLIKEYTEKQWGRKCRDLPSSIIKRLPVRYTFDNNYFNDLYQGVPCGGYTQLVAKMLEGIEVRLNTDFFEHRSELEGVAEKIIYTGPIDEFFDCQFGPLDYRSLHFETEILDKDNFQGNAVVNYIDADVPYTRIIEHKHFEFGQQTKTVITREYPQAWSLGKERYYTVNDEKNSALYAKYKALAERQSKVIFGGRLAEYKYYDMDDVIERAMAVAKQELGI